MTDSEKFYCENKLAARHDLTTNENVVKLIPTKIQVDWQLLTLECSI